MTATRESPPVAAHRPRAAEGSDRRELRGRPAPPTPGVAANLAFGVAGEEPGERNVLGHGQRGQQVEELEDKTDAVATQHGELVIVQPLERLPFEADAPLGWSVHGTAQVQEGGLTAPRRPDERHKLPGLERQADVRERREPAGRPARSFGELRRPREPASRVVDQGRRLWAAT